MRSPTIDDVWRDCHRWITVETALFEQLGEAARSPSSPRAARGSLAAWSNRHGWHADLWRRRLPVIPHHEFPLAPDHLAWLSATRAAIDDDLAALVDPVLTTLQDEVAGHRTRIDPVLDGPTARILDLVAADLVSELDELRRALA